jgi:3-oxocholest-4-en-26-oate---CoA ligase
MSDWNFADVWETVADVHPEATAVVQGARRVSWRDFERRSEGLAGWLAERVPQAQDKVALYLVNGPEYLEAMFACFKARLVPVNTNYRYGEAELEYLWQNSDAVAVVFHGAFTARIDKIRSDVPGVRSWLWVDDGSGPCPEWADAYEQAIEDGGRRSWGRRSGDDLVFLYTGGTTGRPKGVMWRQDDLFVRMNTSGFRRYPLDEGIESIRKDLANGTGMSLLPACPLMHGTGCFTSLECLNEAGTVVLLTGRSFDPMELWDTVDREQVNGLVIVGDPFARPLLEALEAQPGRWQLTSLVGIISSGAMWSENVKRGLLDHHSGMLLIDAFSSSEALGMGTSVSSSDNARHTAEFALGPEVRVLVPGQDRDVRPGSGEVGMLALGGRNPVGYYKDPEKSAATFREIDGVRYSIPGDFAEVNEGGSIHLLGRGSVCINTAGEKVYPEEVEEALKSHDDVRDAVVVGVPHERLGEQVVAVVEPEDSRQVDEGELIDHVKSLLAGYKAPKHVKVVSSIGRSPSGKVDYGRHRQEAAEWLGVATG